MTVAELIEKLKEYPQDLRIMRNAGDWGPQPVKVITVEETRDDGDSHWINYYPEVPDDEGDAPRETNCFNRLDAHRADSPESVLLCA